MNEKDMQHGTTWNGQNLTGWLLSEKFNGCRLYWDGATAWTREGFAREVPVWLHLPPGFALDGELYDGPNGLSRCSKALRHGGNNWRPSMRFIAFDAPNIIGTWRHRLDRAMAATFVYVVECTRATSTAHALAYMDAIQARGGEGAVARHPELRYSAGRTCQILKLKKRVPLRLQSGLAIPPDDIWDTIPATL